MDPQATEILDFWFGSGDEVREVWFRKDPAFDATIHERFGKAVAAAVAGAYKSWTSEARGALACILLLDQFTRNIYRDTAQAFSGDSRALAIAERVVASRQDDLLKPYERSFLYLPYEHSEDPLIHEQSIALFTRLRDETGLTGPLEWAEKHAVIIRRFGRYPHRNAILGRPSTAEEMAFLAGPDSRF